MDYIIIYGLYRRGFKQVRGESWTMFATKRFEKIVSLHLCATVGFLLANWSALFQTLRKMLSFK